MKYLLFLCLAVLIVSTGCRTPLQVVHAADGGKIKIFVILDRGNPKEMNEKQYENRVSVGNWMDLDLKIILHRGSLDPQIIKSEDEYTAAADCYLLKITIVSYNPGSTAARYFVGYGAGACSLNIKYDFIDDKGKLLLSETDGVGSSRGWRHCARKLNHNMHKAIIDALVARQKEQQTISAN